MIKRKRERVKKQKKYWKVHEICTLRHLKGSPQAGPNVIWVCFNDFGVILGRPTKKANNLAVTMAELAARSPHDQKVVGSNPAGSKKNML